MTADSRSGAALRRIRAWSARHRIGFETVHRGVTDGRYMRRGLTYRKRKRKHFSAQHIGTIAAPQPSRFLSEVIDADHHTVRVKGSESGRARLWQG